MRSVKVWDIYVRIFHWTLLLVVLEQFITGEDLQSVHVPFGYFLIFLILSRTVWGFIGPKHARFNDFIYPPEDIIRYLKGLVNGRPIHYVGHNPAGGLMVIVLLLSLFVTAFTGLKTLAAEGKGPLAVNGSSIVQMAYADDDERDHEEGGTYRNGKSETDTIWEEIHEAMTGFMIFLIVIHVCGVIVSSWVHKENLIFSMITGIKKIEER